MLIWLKALLRRFGFFNRRRYPRKRELDALFREVRKKECNGWVR